MPARTLNDFFAGFFYGQIKADLEVKKANTKRPEKVPPQSRVRLDRGSFPSETLISGSSEVGQSMDIAEGTLLKVIYSSAHRSNVTFQVFSGETTPSLGIDLQL